VILGIKEGVTPVSPEEYITREKIHEATGINEDLYRSYPILAEKEKDLSFTELVEVLSANQNLKKTNSIFLDSKHNKLTNISIPVSKIRILLY